MMMTRNFNRRHSPNRRKTRVSARLIVEEASLEVLIRDVSLEGMRLEVPMTLEPGTPVSLSVLDITVPAIIHWSHDGEAGIHLLEHLDRDTLIALETADDEFAEFR